MSIVFMLNEPIQWVTHYFPGFSVYSLPLAGKPLVEHQLDRAARLGMTRVLILDVSYDRRLAERLGDGSRWGLRLDYRPLPMGVSPQEAVDRNRDFLDGEEPKVVEGPEIFYHGGHVYLTSLRDYFELNFKIVVDPDECVLPGYSSDRGVVLGMNVQIRMGCVVTPPILLDDNVLIDYECQLNGSVIVCNGAILDRRCYLHRAIVFPETYIARGVELENKIVVGSRVIDPLTGACVNLAGDVLSFDLRGRRKFSFLSRIARFFKSLLKPLE